jgi:hypothetical protein
MSGVRSFPRTHDHHDAILSQKEEGAEIEMALFLTSTTRAEPARLQLSPKATLVPKAVSSSSTEAVHSAKKLRLILA